MREVLIRYLLGELSPEEHDEVHARLQSSPELRQELAHLRACFAAHQDDELAEDGPPSDLASRTAERVTSGEGAGAAMAAGRCERLTAAGDPPTGLLGWSLADLTVAGGVIIAVSMLIFPALRNSRNETRRAVCQNNLRQRYVFGSIYADGHGNFFPQIKEKDHAGTFVAHFILSGVNQKELESLMICPDSPMAAKIREGFVFELPSADQIRHMTAAQFARFTANASPCYAYILPHRKENEYCYVKNDQRPLSPVFSDAVGDSKTGVLTPNHGSRLIQVQFADGSLKWFKSWKLPGVDDDMSHNKQGLVASGYDPDDIVLANSDATPSGTTDATGE
jgi:hypothetical protein